MEKNLNITLDAVYKYRNKLIESGKKVNFENPDNLNFEELQALTCKIFSELNELDVSLGYETYDTGLKMPAGVNEEKLKAMYIDFLDWYEILATPSNVILNYVKRNYPKEKFPRVICVGDGEHCHLGRKLANLGYTVAVVDPVAKKEFSMSRNEKGGMLKVVRGEFFETSTPMIDWANLIVGAKVPQCAEALTQISKPAIFNISENAEIYNMRFKGTQILSSEQLAKEIEKTPHAKKIKHTDNFGMESYFYVCEDRELEER